MTIKVTYNVTDVYVSETVSATYINVSYETPTGGGGVWGDITGTLSNQTDLQNALNAKFDDPTGTTLQYLRGDGTLATFPTITSGTVTSVGLSSATSGVTIGSSPITTSGTITLAIATATTSQNGLLSSTDWTTFNNKQNTITNPVTGTGTTNYLPKFTGATTLGDSTIRTDSVGNIGINVTPSAWSGVGRSLELANNSFIASQGQYFYLAANYFFNGTTEIRKSNGFASLYAQQVGQHEWYNAPTGTAGDVATLTQRARITSGGNFIINNSATDSGQRLQVTGDTLMKGSGNTSGTTALTVQNSDATNLFRILNDNTINIGLRPAVSIYPTAFGSVQNITGRGIAMSFIASDTAYEPLTLTHGNLTSTANGYLVFNTIGTFNPTSGTATYTANRIGVTINQTGGANGISRGLYVNPTLTAAADWRAIEWSNNTGWGLRGEGTAPNFFNGSLGIGSTTLTGFSLRISKAITGSIESYGISQQGAVSNDVTTVAVGIDNGLVLNAGAVCSSYNHFRARRQVYAATSFGTQIGFLANNSLTDATNNYGFYGDIPAATGRWNLYMNGTAANFLSGDTQIGTGAFTSEKLQVNGTAKVTGASTFGGNMTLSLNQNAGTKIEVSNTTSGTSSVSIFAARSTSGTAELSKNSETTTPYKIAGAGDGNLYNSTGNLNILNDTPFGSIKMASGGSSTAHFTIASTGAATFSSSVQAGGGTTNASAILQADSTTKGFLPPRMTTTQINNIATPAEGLQVYNTTINHMCFYMNGAWARISHSPM